MKPTRHMKHTDLFIIRLWTQDQDDQSGTANAGNAVCWRGKVQRVVSGESHEFKDWETLVNTLRSMTSTTLPHAQSRSLDTTGDASEQE